MYLRALLRRAFSLFPAESLKHSCPLRWGRPFAAATTTVKNKESPANPNPRDTIILEKFKQRQLKGSQSNSKRESKNDKIVGSFEELGLSKEVREGAEEMGVVVPSEIQCVGIPSILEGKNVVLSSSSGFDRTFAYLLPLLQLLRRDEAGKGMRPKHPRAVVLCATDQLCDQVFEAAKFINNVANLKSKTKSDGEKVSEDTGSAPIGMLVGTPGEIHQHIEEGNMVVDDLKYLVVDDVDSMFKHGLGSEIDGIFTLLGRDLSKLELQTILVTSTVKEVLGEELMENFEQDHAGKVAAMLLEMDPSEVVRLAKSFDTLKKKMIEAMDSLH